MSAGKISRSRPACTSSVGTVIAATFFTTSAFEDSPDHVDNHARGVQVRARPSAA
jgi:hypothetical protein